MKKIRWLIVALIVTAVCPFCLAQDQPTTSLGFDFDMSFYTKYMWRGYDLFDDHAAFQPSLTYNLFDTGFSVNLWGSIPVGSGNEEFNELDYTFAYNTTLMEDTPTALDFGAYYVYFDYFKANRFADVQELAADISMPNLLPVGPGHLVPSYLIAKDWPNKSNTPDVAGWFHILGLSYDLPVPCIFAPDTTRTLNFYTNLIFNDGAFAADHDWSALIFGVSSSGVNLGPVNIQPSIHYQFSLDDSVNHDNELWAGISLYYSF